MEEKGGRWRKMRRGALGKGRTVERGNREEASRRRNDRGHTETRQPGQPAASVINDMCLMSDMHRAAPRASGCITSPPATATQYGRRSREALFNIQIKSLLFISLHITQAFLSPPSPMSALAG